MTGLVLLAIGGERLYAMALRNYRAGRLERAAHLIERAIAKNPKRWDYHFLAGKIFEAKRRFAKSLAHYRKALSLLKPWQRKKRLRVRAAIVRVLVKAGRRAEALRILRTIRRESPPQTSAENIEFQREILQGGTTEALSIIVEPMNVAVLPLEGTNGEQAASNLTTYLQDRFCIVERSQMEKIVQEQKMSLTGITSSQYEKLGRLLDVDALVVGNCSKDGKWEISIRLVNASSGAVIASAVATGGELSECCKKAAIELKKAVPRTQGKVVKQSGGKIYLDQALKKGCLVVIYKEGEEIKTEEGESLGREIEIIATAEVTSSSQGYAVATLLGEPKEDPVGKKFVVK